MKYLSAPLLLILTFFTLPAVSQDGKKAMEELHKANMKTMSRYTCETALIQLNLDAHTKKNWDAVIAKANECIIIDSSAIAFEIRGEAYVNKGNYASALADYTKAIEAGKRESDSIKVVTGTNNKHYHQSLESLVGIYERRSDIYVANGDRTKAEADLKTALTILPGSSSAKGKLATLDNRLAEKAKEQRMNNPQSAADYVFLGSEKNRMGKYKDALLAFTKAISLDATNAEAYIGRGNAHTYTGTDINAALADYNKALTLAPGSAEAYAGRGYAYRNKKDWEAAIKDFTAAITYGKASADLLNARASAHAGKSNYTEALTDYTAALNFAGDSKYSRITSLTGQGDAFRMQGNSAEAINAYTSAIDAAKGDYMASFFLTETYLGRGKLYASNKKPELATADFKETLKLDANHIEAKAELAKLTNLAANTQARSPQTAVEWSLWGRNQVRQRAYDDAIVSFTKSISLQPDTAYYYALRGAAYISKGDLPSFKADFEKAIKLAPTDKQIYFIRGNMLYSKGYKEESAADFRKVLQLDPAHQLSKERLKEMGFE